MPRRPPRPLKMVEDMEKGLAPHNVGIRLPRREPIAIQNHMNDREPMMLLAILFLSEVTYQIYRCNTDQHAAENIRRVVHACDDTGYGYDKSGKKK